MTIQKAIQSSGDILCGMMGTKALASRLLVVVAVIGCHDGNGLSLRYMLSLRSAIHSQERSDEVMPIQKAIQSSGEILCAMMGTEGLASRLLAVVAVIGCHLMATAHPFVICSPIEILSIRETVALVMQRSSRHYTGEGCGRRNMSKEDCYLVDPASSHMLVSKIKPCMCKYELIQTVKLRMAHKISYSLFDGIYYSDNRSNSIANTCNKPRLAEGMHLLGKRSTRAQPVALMIHDNSTECTTTVPRIRVRFRRGSLRNGYHIHGKQQARKLPNLDTGSWTLGWVDRSASGVHRSARPFCRRCALGLNWPGRASGAVTLRKLECSKQAYALDTLAWDNIIGF
ncbi:hypothetical protein G2W53_039997 [Senna tora]|uniref:Uncharacterized protein n=1 Tax=Senna tora TaxID=362788 RepID=A0A834SQW3_9FABA|nr:hypothetical protein G2W53_039997 [Senna tora]